jgi:superfamily II DNA/RNA helicase
MRFAPLTKEDEAVAAEEDGGAPIAGLGVAPTAAAATLRDLNLCLDPGLRHERVVAPDGTELLCLARMLRQELHEFEAANVTRVEDTGTDAEDDSYLGQLRTLREDTKEFDADFDALSIFATSDTDSIDNLQRPRVVVFFPDEDEARQAIYSLRDAMWGEHTLGVMLPETGENPLKIMEAFREGSITVLLATPNSIRGLDFPALTHVYTLFLPAEDPREYLHLAGRVGRIGQQGSVRGQGGRVTTILDEDEAPQFDQLANFLGFEYENVEPIKSEVTEESDVEDMRKFLEDTITLLDTVDEPEANYVDDNGND